MLKTKISFPNPRHEVAELISRGRPRSFRRLYCCFPVKLLAVNKHTLLNIIRTPIRH